MSETIGVDLSALIPADARDRKDDVKAQRVHAAVEAIYKRGYSILRDPRQTTQEKPAAIEEAEYLDAMADLQPEKMEHIYRPGPGKKPSVKTTHNFNSTDHAVWKDLADIIGNPTAHSQIEIIAAVEALRERAWRANHTTEQPPKTDPIELVFCYASGHLTEALFKKTRRWQLGHPKFYSSELGYTRKTPALFIP